MMVVVVLVEEREQVVSVEHSFEKLVLKKKVTNVSHTTAVRKIIKITWNNWNVFCVLNFFNEGPRYSCNSLPPPPPRAAHHHHHYSGPRGWVLHISYLLACCDKNVLNSNFWIFHKFRAKCQNHHDAKWLCASVQAKKNKVGSKRNAKICVVIPPFNRAFWRLKLVGFFLLK